jgi:hypothetical protein
MSSGGSDRHCSLRLVAATVCASVVASLAGTAGATSSTHALTAHLTRTTSAVGARKASGRFTGKLIISGKNSSFTWKVTSAHLSGAALHAGIYFGKVATASKLAMLLCNACNPAARGYYHGSYVAGRRFVRAILRGHAYVVIQTKRSPRGEIQGRIKSKT